MDGWGIAIATLAGIAYLVTGRKHSILAFASGVGVGILVGAVWAAWIVNSVIK